MDTNLGDLCARLWKWPLSFPSWYHQPFAMRPCPPLKRWSLVTSTAWDLGLVMWLASADMQQQKGPPLSSTPGSCASMHRLGILWPPRDQVQASVLQGGGDSSSRRNPPEEANPDQPVPSWPASSLWTHARVQGKMGGGPAQPQTRYVCVIVSH